MVALNCNCISESEISFCEKSQLTGLYICENTDIDINENINV